MIFSAELKIVLSFCIFLFIYLFSESCDKVQCSGRKTCLLDQVLRPHCVRCQGFCSSNSFGDYVCGADNVTYSSTCHIRQAACMKGKAVQQAYRGKCKGMFFFSFFIGVCHLITCLSIMLISFEKNIYF